MAYVFLFQFKVHRCSAFFVFKSETQEGPQFSLGFPDKGMQDGCLVHSIFDARFLPVYFILSQDNFIFGNVISMWGVLFVFAGADQLEHATPILSLCHGIFTD